MDTNTQFNKKVILKKALNVFWKNGYAASSIKELSVAMEINCSSLYYNIGNKHALFLECLAFYLDEQHNAVIKIIDKNDKPLRTIENIVEMGVKSALSDKNSSFAVKVCFELSHDPAVIKLIRTANERFEKLLTELFEKSSLRGEIRIIDSPQIHASYFVASFAGWRESFLLHQKPLVIKKFARILLQSLN